MEKDKKAIYNKISSNTSNFLFKIFSSNENKSAFNKVKASVIALSLGLLVGGILIAINGTDFIQTYWLMIKGSFRENNWKSLIIYSGAFAIFGLSIIFSFKTGLFNIGASGQMYLGAGVGLYTMFSLNSVSGWSFLLALLISITLGFLTAAFAGVLKAFFNVNEVITTILFNFIAYYIIQQMYEVGTPYYSGTGGPSSIALSKVSSFIKNNSWIIIFVLTIISSFSVWFLLRKTSFGYQLKVVGESQNVAKYAGINVKLMTILSMGISGALAGLAGGLLYLFKVQAINQGNLPSYGYDGIAVALLAFNSPLGVAFAGLFYGILNQGQTLVQLELHVGPEIYQVVVGVIIYFAAIALIFEKTGFLKYVKKWIISLRNKSYIELRQKAKFETKNNKQFYIDKIKEYKLIKNKNKIEINKIKNKAKIDYKKIEKEYNRKASTETILNIDSKKLTVYEFSNMRLAELGYFLKKDAKAIYKSKNKNIKITLRESRNKLWEVKLKELTNNSTKFKNKEIKFMELISKNKLSTKLAIQKKLDIKEEIKW